MLSALVTAAEETHSPVLPSIPDLLWGTIVFLILLVFFLRYALPRLNKLLDERREAIDGNIARAERLQNEANEALEHYTAQLAEARSEAGRIREQARADGAGIIAEMKEQATAEAARITANVQVQLESERAAALASLRNDVGTLALDLASSIVGEVLSDDKRAEAIVDRFLADLEADEKSKAGK
ncbi:F0F1 ATP synthase subunit B [Humibacter ginsenosidimutans]|uniref:ATP synthase subunit b n=1 Tax=Humibacter ginsenosidimutans TaxID=2599293 RepID=A0A5B8M7T5_9MICO|nr:F0F1 ATP synthase subunit B [Humibacter ginsenosidimutans]QDZ16547.1 F0F1 ATP synthase subunit B [Humibacter ginsenosidimutans]